MNKEEKVKAVEELKGQLADYKSIYLTDIAGLNAVQTSKLRRECFNSNVKLSVVKNTFLERAMTESENDFGELKDLLKGNTTIMLSAIGNSPAKVIKKFRANYCKVCRIIYLVLLFTSYFISFFYWRI